MFVFNRIHESHPFGAMHAMLQGDTKSAARLRWLKKGFRQI